MNNNRNVVTLVIILALLLLGFYMMKGRESRQDSASIAEAALFVCQGSKSVTALWSPEDFSRVSLRLSHSPRVKLSQEASAEGAMYASPNEHMTFWSQGQTAFITENGQTTYSDCRMLEWSEE